jgi:hypothetical protein
LEEYEKKGDIILIQMIVKNIDLFSVLHTLKSVYTQYKNADLLHIFNKIVTDERDSVRIDGISINAISIDDLNTKLFEIVCLKEGNGITLDKMNDSVLF